MRMLRGCNIWVKVHVEVEKPRCTERPELQTSPLPVLVGSAPQPRPACHSSRSGNTQAGRPPPVHAPLPRLSDAAAQALSPNHHLPTHSPARPPACAYPQTLPARTCHSASPSATASRCCQERITQDLRGWPAGMLESSYSRLTPFSSSPGCRNLWDGRDRWGGVVGWWGGVGGPRKGGQLESRRGSTRDRACCACRACRPQPHPSPMVHYTPQTLTRCLS